VRPKNGHSSLGEPQPRPLGERQHRGLLPAENHAPFLQQDGHVHGGPGRLLFGLLLALVLLALLIWLIYGFIKPNRFPENLKVNWGKPIKRLERNEMPVSEVPRSGRGFYRNAQLWVGGRHCFMGSGLPATARFEATSRRGVSIIAEEGATVERVNKFDREKLEPVTSGSPVGLGDVYKINDLLFRLKL
jgi:hypothetical protein